MLLLRLFLANQNQKIICTMMLSIDLTKIPSLIIMICNMNTVKMQIISFSK